MKISAEYKMDYGGMRHVMFDHRGQRQREIRVCGTDGDAAWEDAAPVHSDHVSF